MEDATILRKISALIDREHELRTQSRAGAEDHEAQRRELAAAEVELDQCWDLLRQRRAKRALHEQADEAQVRPPGVVEHYLQ